MQNKFSSPDVCNRCNGWGFVMVDTGASDMWCPGPVSVKKCPTCRPKPKPVVAKKSLNALMAAIPPESTSVKLPPLQLRDATFGGICACGCPSPTRVIAPGDRIWWAGSEISINGVRGPGTVWHFGHFPRGLAVRYLVRKGSLGEYERKVLFEKFGDVIFKTKQPSMDGEITVPPPPGLENIPSKPKPMGVPRRKLSL